MRSSESRCVTSTAETGSVEVGPSSCVVSRSSPRQVPPERTAGSAVAAYRACDQPSRWVSRREPATRALGRKRWKASLAQTTVRPRESSTATRSGLASSTRVSSWARRASSSSSVTSSKVRRAPPDPSPRGVIDRSIQRRSSLGVKRRSRPRTPRPVASACRAALTKSSRPSASMASSQPSSSAEPTGWPVNSVQRPLAWRRPRSASSRAIPVGLASTSRVRSRSSAAPVCTPSGPSSGRGGSLMCGRGDSNPHALRRRLLKPVRLPVAPRPQRCSLGRSCFPSGQRISPRRAVT